MSIKKGREGLVGCDRGKVFSSKVVQRVLLSAGFIPLLILVIHLDLFDALPFFIFTLALSVLGARELYSLFVRMFSFRSERWWVFCLPGALLIILFYLNSFFDQPYLGILYITGYTLTVGAGACVFCCWRGSFLKSFLVMVLGYAYTGLCPLAMLGIRIGYGPLYIYFLFLLGWIDDAGAYFVGIKFGRTRGIVKYSPNKSLEGYVAAFFITVAAGIGFKLAVSGGFGPGLWETAGLGFLVAVLAPAGDIVESVVKRKAGTKDSSALLPGFGGVLDIFDSILFASPVYCMMLIVLLKY